MIRWNCKQADKEQIRSFIQASTALWCHYMQGAHHQAGQPSVASRDERGVKPAAALLTTVPS